MAEMRKQTDPRYTQNTKDRQKEKKKKKCHLKGRQTAS